MAFDFLKKMFGLKQEKGKSASDEPSKAIGTEQDATLNDHVPDFAYEAAKPITNKRLGLLDLLPSFTDMEKDATAEEVIRVAGIASTILNLTFKNPFPIDQDPVFGTVLKIWTESLKNQLKEGKYTIESHEELKDAYSSKYPENIVESMMEIDNWNQRMIEHAVITKTLGKTLSPKPAYQCFQAALNLSSFAGESSAVLIVNYAHLLLKCSLLKMVNPIAINDIVSVLKKASAFLHFEEGMNYRPQGETVIDEDRYFFYNDRCSFKLSKEDIKQDNVEKDGLKHTLMTESLGMIVIEIRPCLPYFGGSPMVTTKNMEVAGYPCLEASVMGMTHQYYIDCGSFVVQVDMVVPSLDFLNSFSHSKKKDVPTQEASFVQNGNVYTVNGVSFEMINVDGNFFVMGAPDDDEDAWEEERPQHQVSLDSYAIGQTQVTQELWEAVMKSNPSEFKGKKRPVENVSWLDCHIFINKLNEITGKSFRLPTEAEWEFAARGGRKHNGHKKYSGSECIDDVAWYKENSDNQTHEVATKKPNELGIYDMNGNVAEWCEDSYKEYTSESQINPKVVAPHDARPRVDRGGGWQCTARECRITLRSGTGANLKYNCLGLRLAL